MKKNIVTYGKHFIDQSDIDAVINVLKGNTLTQGPNVLSFEKAIANYVGAKYAVAVSTWTSGLHIAYLAAGLTKNDSLITSPITFVATSNAAKYCGAKPIFSDIDDETVNLCTKQLSNTLKKHPNAKILVPVHFAGLPCKMNEINKIAKENNLIVIEDAAHALGAKYEDGSMVGNCKYSDMTGFSFHPVKSIAAGEGGMITTNSKEIYRKLLRLRSHGINKIDDNFINYELAFTNGIQNPWYYEMQELGYNYRITDIQCALGESQLKKLNKFILKRSDLVKKYDAAFKNFKNLKPIQIHSRVNSSHHIYPVRINYGSCNISRAELMHKLKEEGILTQVHYMPVPMHPYYNNLNYNMINYPNSSKFYNEALTLPLYYSLSDNDQNRVIDSLNKLIG